MLRRKIGGFLTVVMVVGSLQLGFAGTAEAAYRVCLPITQYEPQTQFKPCVFVGRDESQGWFFVNVFVYDNGLPIGLVYVRVDDTQPGLPTFYGEALVDGGRYWATVTVRPGAGLDSLWEICLTLDDSEEWVCVPADL